MAERFCSPVKPEPFHVGINYPVGFNQYGTYFGHNARDSDPNPNDGRWLIPFRHNLEQWSSIGVRLVRIFILGNLESFMTRSHGWICPTPATPMHPQYVRQFEEMLSIASANNIMMIPSLVDFGIGEPFVAPGRTQSSRDDGRARIVTDATLREQFFDATLEPLLDVSVAHPETIFAWEVMNEPWWLVSRWWPWDGNHIWSWAFGRTPGFCPAAATISEVSTFLQNGIARIESRSVLHGKSTVGHRHLDDLNTWPSGAQPQFHYYGRTASWWSALGRDLAHTIAQTPPPDRDTLPTDSRLFLGEFSATDRDRRVNHHTNAFEVENEGAPWPWLDANRQLDPMNRITDRLRSAEKLRYRAALVWPTTPVFDPVNLIDVKISSDVRNGISAFTGKRNASTT